LLARADMRVRYSFQIMNGKHRVTLAVISDLHFCNARTEGSGSELSHVVIQKFHESPGKNPWIDLMELVKRENIQADLLLCPGDITTHAAHEPLKVAWRSLIDLGRELHVSLMACATGNHDVCSRISDTTEKKEAAKENSNPIRELDNPQDLFENLKLLSPEYPLHVYADTDIHVTKRQRRIQYFGADFIMHEDEHYRIIVFNSCARHINDKAIYERGIIANSTLIELREQLKVASTPKINIFLCHHHPIPHSNAGAGSYDFIFRGDELVRCLQEHGDWVIIHGHKHDGRIVYASHGSPASAPVVFSASSMGAILSSEQLNKYRNQFYLLDIYLPEKGCSRGTVRVWNWHLSNGWSKSIDPRVGLTDGVGFGERRHPDDLAEKVAQSVNIESVAWSTVVEEFPFINNLTPAALNDLLKSLNRHHDIVEMRDPNSNCITEIGRSAK